MAKKNNLKQKIIQQYGINGKVYDKIYDRFRNKVKRYELENGKQGEINPSMMIKYHFEQVADEYFQSVGSKAKQKLALNTVTDAEEWLDTQIHIAEINNLKTTTNDTIPNQTDFTEPIPSLPSTEEDILSSKDAYELAKSVKKAKAKSMINALESAAEFVDAVPDGWLPTPSIIEDNEELPIEPTASKGKASQILKNILNTPSFSSGKTELPHYSRRIEKKIQHHFKNFIEKSDTAKGIYNNPKLSSSEKLQELTKYANKRQVLKKERVKADGAEFEIAEDGEY